MAAKATSPASSGPAGSYFEGQVGAHYLLSMLTGAEPRGLPGTAIDRIEFQRAAEGRQLDDVIVHAHGSSGAPAVLEIQVKRSISFAPGDQVFLAVVGQIAEASRRPDFWTTHYELAIATARTSRKIDGAYQDVLTWARELGSSATFMDRIARPGSANDDMRTFVRTFKAHLSAAGSPEDDETAWRLLRKLQILIFDFTAQGSVSKELAKERAVRALHPDDTLQAENLWTVLIELALQIAVSGGDRTRDRLNEDLTRRSFRLAGERRFASARAVLAEASRNTLDDIEDRVGDVMLTRHEHVAAIHAVLDRGRYIEIRGDAGVGKSGLMKHFAKQIAIESQVVVLSPDRTIGKGWIAMRAMLGFEGTAHELLTDLAGDGGAILFIDNLDFFKEEERKTVVDLVREAPNVPGFVVVATARRNFGFEEESWLPQDALDRLGQTEPIVIGELSESEVEEMGHAAPRLASLLADNHRARPVTRNLFRLARLANWRGNEPFPRTEVDMAEQWWKTADGTRNSNYRERARLLKALAEQALTDAETLNVSDLPTAGIDALIASETLSDLGSDRVAFRHDVLREWAIANLLHSERTMIERLPLDRPAPAALARGVELTARMFLERADDATRWFSFVGRLSRTGAHGSWRRAALLALTRSEIGTELLNRASDLLLADRGSLLRELIRIVMAVDVQPASQFFAAVGIDPATIPPSLYVPSGPSWYRLIVWLLSLGETMPPGVIPEVVDLYTAWSIGTLGSDPLTLSLLYWLYRWLIEIEESRDAETFHDLRQPFGGEINQNQIRSLEPDLRNSFLLFCNRTPALAVEYLRSLGKRRHNHDAVRSILKNRGSLAQAAPAELAELTENALIAKPDSQEVLYGSNFDRPFRCEYEFLPTSPTQGPFLELLTHSPQHGLSLIHRLVDHAIFFYSEGSEYATDVIIISLPDGERAFPWKQSYWWSRGLEGPYCIASALKALEAWAHRRIEDEETFERVLADVLGPPNSPAAYLLVAVDLLLAHWPKSREAAIPFLSCPELLCIENHRQMHENHGSTDLFELKAFEKKSVGVANLQELLGRYAVYEPVELREKLITLLRHAATRLGPPDKQSNFGDPAFMVIRALNLVDPDNWREIPVTLANGKQVSVHEYVQPEAENRHLLPQQEAFQSRLTDSNMQAIISLAIEDPSRSSSEFATAAVDWAKRSTTVPKGENSDDRWIRERAIISSAMIVMRDGNTDLRAQHSEWAHNIFVQAMQTEEDPVHRMLSGLPFNPIATAFVGMIYALKDHSVTGDVRALLEAAARNPSTAHGLGTAVTTLASVDERLLPAVLRCAFAGCIRPRRKRELPKKDSTARSKHYRQRIQKAVNAELAWLADKCPEPVWPMFPTKPVRLRRRIRLPGGLGPHDLPRKQRILPDEYVDYYGAALWLRNARGIINITQRPWLRDIVRTYGPWTAAANGAGLEPNDEVDSLPSEWNNAYFDLAARCLPGLELPEIEQLVINLINSLPDEPFFDVVTQFLPSLDNVYFNDLGLQEHIAVSVRSALATRLMESSGWKRLQSSKSLTIEVHIGPAIAVLFFNYYGHFQPARCYLPPNAIDRINSFLPILEKLVKSGPSLFVAVVTLNLLEVSPRTTHLPFLVTAAKSWMESYRNNKDFWVDHGIGRRLCLWIEGVLRQEPAVLDKNNEIRFDVDQLLSALINLGVADARRLEEALAGES